MTERDRLRKSLRRYRSTLSGTDRARAADRVAKQFLQTRWFRSAYRVAGYLAVGGELDIWATLMAAYEARKQIYLPVLAWDKRLWFQRWTPQTPLRRNRFGILEPEASARYRVKARSLDVVLTPLVGFDHEGNRLGMGGGFYDRTFDYQLLLKKWLRPSLVGIAYDFQETSSLNKAPWDVPLTGIITPTGARKFSRKG
ncbi:5-formyltetrahydrofolate cyclo-ligase [Acidihalobacter prosperus]